MPIMKPLRFSDPKFRWEQDSESTRLVHHVRHSCYYDNRLVGVLDRLNPAHMDVHFIDTGEVIHVWKIVLEVARRTFEAEYKRRAGLPLTDVFEDWSFRMYLRPMGRSSSCLA